MPHSQCSGEHGSTTQSWLELYAQIYMSNKLPHNVVRQCHFAQVLLTSLWSNGQDTSLWNCIPEEIDVRFLLATLLLFGNVVLYYLSLCEERVPFKGWLKRRVLYVL